MKTSLVIITLNRYKLLERCLESLCRQSELPDETVIVDNGGLAETKNACESFSKKLPIVFIREQKQGYGFARNAGIKAAKNEIIAFTDDDCVLSKNWLAELKKSFLDSECSLAAGLVEPLKTEKPTEIQRYLDKKNNLSIKNQQPRMITGFFPNMAVRRKVFEKIGLVDEAMPGNEDSDFFWRAQEQGFKACLNFNAVVYHENRRTLSGFYRQLFVYGKGSVLLAKKHKESQPEHFAQRSYLAIAKNLLHGTIAIILGLIFMKKSSEKLFFGLEKTFFYLGILWGKIIYRNSV